MSRLPIQSVSTAPEAARDRLEAAAHNNGFIPNLLGVLANAPAALEAYQVLGAINGRNSLTPAEREVVQITAARYNDCGFCVAGHTRLARQKLRLPEALIEALRHTRAPEDPKLDGLAKFTLQVLEHRGDIPETAWADFQAAGYEPSQALDVVLGVSLATLCNYTNNFAHTPLNAELQAFA